ncbi:transcriptional regulator family: Fungal Specific TF [Aspergillus niger]|nr:transcriptional regulator family: Fungal Specific TF [Aspergillus niger]
MDRSSEPRERSRQACEPCRRRKTKCPGERPVCSTCQRLNHQCVYSLRDRANVTSGRVTKAYARATQDRLRILESQVNDLYGALCSRSSKNGEPSPGTPESNNTSLREQDCQAPLRGSPSDISAFSPTSPHPPAETLGHFIEVYRKVLHLQPLPLFDMDTLQSDLAKAPEFLLWSFLALILSFSGHEFYHGRESDARNFYSQSAEQAVVKMAVEGIPRVEVLQSLCLLALRHIKEGKEAQACMTIGMASRLQSFRTLQQHNNQTEARDLTVSRCHWSIRILESIFTPQLSIPSPPQTPIPPEYLYPPSAPLPPPLPSVSPTHTDLFDTTDPTNDLGIVAYGIQLIIIWGETASYVHSIRTNPNLNEETPWSLSSTYSKLNHRRNEHETQLPESHLLRNVAFTKRSRAEISAHQEYWTSWISMQIFCHALVAIQNHPFIHLVILGGNRGVSQSRLFLQQTVDHALFHSEWVFRLVQAWENFDLPLHDPLIAHLVAATASISWIFQFARDRGIGEKARGHLVVAERLLSRMSTVWPHVSHRLKTIHALQSSASVATTNPSISSEHQSAATTKGTTITIQPSLFWDLLDPKICPTEMPASSGPAAPGARMRVTTQFMHPLSEDEPSLGQGGRDVGRVGGGNEGFMPDVHVQELEQLSLDELFGQLGDDTFTWAL